MAKYRKKPVVIEAWVAKELSSAISKDWNLGLVPECIKVAYEKGGWVFLTSGEIHIPTLEGTMIASPDDFVIKGVNGEFYPCKPDIFEKTYELEETTFLDRLKVERLELGEKSEKLYKFLNLDNKTVSGEQRELLCEQYSIMANYLNILDRRINLSINEK